jgi:Na+/H+ antiporter NhaC
MKKFFVFFLLFLLVAAVAYASENKTHRIPSIVFTGKILPVKDIGSCEKIFLNGREIVDEKIVFSETGENEIKVIDQGLEYVYWVYTINGWLTILPPLIAIVLALIFKEVVISLFVGIFAGSVLLNRFDILKAFFNVIDKYIINALADKDRASIVIFTLLLGGMVGIITKSGGVKGIVDRLSRKVRSQTGTQFYTWLMGIFIFFDDYTNTLIVGNTMRPLTDKWNISREKLSYIVDSTAAPMASIALISTWIGFEVSLINQSLEAYHIKLDAYHLFLSSLPYRFYPLLALLLVMLIFLMKREYGPMLKAERRARKGKPISDEAVPLADFESSGLNPAENAPARWVNGLIPIMVVILFTFGGLFISGREVLMAQGNPLVRKSFFKILGSSNLIKDLGVIISAADSFRVLLWASLSGVVTALCLSFFQKILRLREAISALVQGMKSMMMAILILVLAWSLGVVLVELNTADFLVSLLSSSLDYRLFPSLIFIFSGVIAFSTGTSWGTIGIMYPLVIPITIGLMKGLPEMQFFLILTISSVLAGAVFGDHCSPISDTTIMSSMASSCDHIDHVKTQIPYALTAALVSLGFGILPVSFGFPYWAAILFCLIMLVLILLILGKKIN